MLEITVLMWYFFETERADRTKSELSIEAACGREQSRRRPQGPDGHQCVKAVACCPTGAECEGAEVCVNGGCFKAECE